VLVGDAARRRAEVVFEGVGSSGDRNFLKGFGFGIGGIPCHNTRVG
jgi:hypothetical protein